LSAGMLHLASGGTASSCNLRACPVWPLSGLLAGRGLSRTRQARRPERRMPEPLVAGLEGGSARRFGGAREKDLVADSQHDDRQNAEDDGGGLGADLLLHGDLLDRVPGLS